MYIYHDEIIRIEIGPNADFVLVQWHDMEIFNISDYELSFTTLMSLIGQYNVKKVIINMSESVKGVPEPYYHSAIGLLMSGFCFHQVEKIARISTSNPMREARSISYTQKLITGMQLEVQFQVFATCQEAIAWVRQESLSVA